MFHKSQDLGNIFASVAVIIFAEFTLARDSAQRMITERWFLLFANFEVTFINVVFSYVFHGMKLAAFYGLYIQHLE